MLQLVNIRKYFGSQTNNQADAGGHLALNNVSLTIEQGEFFSLLGPSGCGKTTLMRIIAGLETQSSGEIILDGQKVDHLPAQKRPFNMVFQRYALFPHMTVAQNIAYGLKLKNVPNKETLSRVEEALHMVEMAKFADRFPDTLSGGQAQRVALARALVNRPKVLLLDEPLSALDLKLREHMQTELRTLQKKLGLTFIYVTHDQEEALALSDRIGVMNHGCLEQVSTPLEIYESPKTVFAAQFVGSMSRLNGEVLDFENELVVLKLADDCVIRGRSSCKSKFIKGHRIEAFVRPEKMRMFELQSAPGLNNNFLQGQIVQQIFKGDQTETHVEVGSFGIVKVTLTRGRGEKILDLGAHVALQFEPEDTHVFETSN